MGILTDGSPTLPFRIDVGRSVNNPSLYKKGPITETKVKVAGTTMDQRRSYGKEYVKRAIQTHDEADPPMTHLRFKHISTRIGTWNERTPTHAAREKNRYAVGSLG